jgi:mRNA-degrading endonuclease toxin of MazEF toxin-antitoxin module
VKSICPLRLHSSGRRSSLLNGLGEISQIAIDKITALPAVRIGSVIGEADDALLLRVNRALALFLGVSARPIAFASR